mmetsp:Transcript_23792/g.62339  ORF Transcript_23792/g.62339 Transcript_23792/m.62339 type:complete len:322 (-) Transcript_23792:94-1059(-)
MDILVTLSSCSCSPSVSRNSGSISSVFFRSKALMPSTWSTDTWDFSLRMIGAKALMPFRRCSTATNSGSVARSILFSRMRSAKATCSTASFSAPSGFSSSRCWMMCFASTSVMIPSNLANAATFGSTKKVCATGAGSAMPVVSITMPSSFKVPACTRFASLSSTTTKSCLTVQQMHPFIISMISSSACILVFFFSKSSSMPTSPNSFSITANFLPCCCVRMWFNNVVLPEPRNPVSTVTGTLSASSIAAMSRPVKKSCFWLHARPGGVVWGPCARRALRRGSALPASLNRTYRGIPRHYEEPGYAQPASIVSSHSGAHATL